MDTTASALTLLDCLERGDLDGLRAHARALRRERVNLRADGLELIERAVALERVECLHELLRLGSSGLMFELFGHYHREFLARVATECLHSGRIRVLIELLSVGPVLPQLGIDAALVDRIARAAIVEFALDDDHVATLVRACGTNQGVFLVYALGADRLSLVQRLAQSCTSAQSWGASLIGEVPLIAAAEAGHIAALRVLVAAGARPNIALRGRGRALHFAVCCERLSGTERAELVHELLRLGAVPELCDAHGMDAYALAASRQDSEVMKVLSEYGRAYGPRQSREARARGIRDICLHYDKADGLIYRIGQPDVVFFSGGDYDGAYPCKVEEFRVAFEQLRKRRQEIVLEWFSPFLSMLERGQEFPYHDLYMRAPNIRLVRFNESSNWSQMAD